MRLSDLMGAKAGAHGNVEITGLTADSRDVRPGYLFAAFSGTETDGARFINDAMARGAVAVLAEKALDAPVPVLVSDDARHCLAQLAARFFAAQPDTVAAVTGTSGKSSIVWFLRQIWASLGLRAASLGTLGVQGPDGYAAGSLTTPDPVALHRDVAGLACNGVTHLAVEASSHGLVQRRLDGLRLSGGIFTNLGHDHLDYHRDRADYLQAKLRLFKVLMPDGAPAVINRDDPVAADVAAAARDAGLHVVTYGQADADFVWAIQDSRLDGQTITIAHADDTQTVNLPLIGAFQAENVTAAVALAVSLGSAFRGILAALPELEGAPGRLQLAGSKGNAAAFVDYAHKPDALAAVIGTLRPLTRGRLIVVFGCGGDRDTQKRPMMGEIAARAADVAIVTDDNPRSEDPAAIRHAILQACPGGIEIGDRAAAIHRGVDLMGDGDVLLVAGKGHETGQKIGTVVHPFDDMAVTRAALEMAA
ncbi:MAG: UDP-N-acetylmuramoyl-L-alanyl-D-glutamate--2,6-diaminopimelate ligase [Minwuia sp.]|nr:UDP-N-acetylmuramoyl-L-alanyl-D-glutamate--2,6-diaminopimelate ligase [Minwuia sp.]